jgi:glycosyltransferase involved in cell wall biosynthesis
MSASADGASEPVRVTVAIPTFRRNQHLAELVPLLLAQCRDLSSSGVYVAEVLVVDNDPGGGARDLVRSWAGEGVRYVHEATPGLSAARNRALSESPKARLLAFMDDDGRPDDGWLSELVRTWAVDRPAAVAGRVVERFEVEPDPWIVAGRFFRRRSMLTHTSVEAAPAGNLLLDLDAVRRLGLRFDPRFGFSGGEDTLFTRSLTSAGERIVWCDESRVVDLVPRERMTRRWVLTRAFSHGSSWSQVEQALRSTPSAQWAARVRAGAAGAVRVVGGLGVAALGLLTRSPRRQARGLRAAMRGAGMVYGAVGGVVEEYVR